MLRVLESVGPRGMSRLELHARTKAAGIGDIRWQDLSEARKQLELRGEVIKVDEFTYVARSQLFIPAVAKPGPKPKLAAS